jgi:chromosome segregation ATPase
MEFDDIVKIVDQVKGLEDRIAVVEAEREKYQGLADNRLNCIALYRDLIGKHEARIGVLADKLNLAEAERDAARAEAARALEALQSLRIPLARLGDFMYSPVRDASQELLAIVNSVLANTYTQPALDWLAQQRREAAAEENDRWADDWWGRKGDCTASDFTARAAAIRAGEVGG